MAETFVYQKPTDNVAASASTVAVQSGTGDPDYLPANLYDLNPSKPAKLTTTTGAWTWNYAAPQRIDIAAIIGHNLTPGLEVRLQGNAADAWGAPTLNQAFTIAAYREDGFPYNPWLDLSVLVPVAANRTFAWWRLVVVGVNTYPIAIGEVWFGNPIREFGIRNIAPGSTRTERRPIVEHKTDMLMSLKVDQGVTQRALKASMENTDATHALITSWMRSCQYRMKPTLIVPDPNDNDAWLATFASTEQDHVRARRNYKTIELQLEEVSPGLVLYP